MSIVALKLAACALFGVLLAQSWLPVGAGFLGAGVIVAAAWRQGLRWKSEAAAPEAAERAALLSIAGTLVCLGYFLTMLFHLGPELDVHARLTRKMANELWILIAASVAAQWLVQAPQATRDELDASIAARALSASCWILLALQAGLVAWFGLGLAPGHPLRSVDMLVHLLIGSWMVAHVFYGLCCAHTYASLRLEAGKAA